MGCMVLPQLAEEPSDDYFNTREVMPGIEQVDVEKASEDGGRFVSAAAFLEKCGTQDRGALRNQNIDFLRVCAALAVVWLHVSGNLVISSPSVGSVNWWVANVADSVSRWCVPVFMMISGALILPSSKRPLGFFYRRRLLRVGVPLVFWTAFYWIFRYLNGAMIELNDIVRSFSSTGSYFHLWYLYMLVGFILVAPLLHLAISYISGAHLAFLWVSCLVVAAVGTLIPGALSATVFGLPVPYVGVFLPYVGYFVAGYHLRVVSIPFSRITVLSVSVLCGLLVSVFTGALFPQLGELSWSIMYSYLNPLVIGMSLGVYVAVVNAEMRVERFEPLIRFLAPLTLGVYVIHPVWLFALDRSVFNDVALPSIVKIPVLSFLAFGLSALCTRCLLLFPGLRRVVA